MEQKVWMMWESIILEASSEHEMRIGTMGFKNSYKPVSQKVISPWAKLFAILILNISIFWEWSHRVSIVGFSLVQSAQGASFT